MQFGSLNPLATHCHREFNTQPAPRTNCRFSLSICTISASTTSLLISHSSAFYLESARCHAHTHTHSVTHRGSLDAVYTMLVRPASPRICYAGTGVFAHSSQPLITTHAAGPSSSGTIRAILALPPPRPIAHTPTHHTHHTSAPYTLTNSVHWRSRVRAKAR